MYKTYIKTQDFYICFILQLNKNDITNNNKTPRGARTPRGSNQSRKTDHMNNITRAERSTVKFCEGVEVEGYLLPSGEFRVGKSSTALALGYGKDWVARTINGVASGKGKDAETLIRWGFSNEIIPLEVEGMKGIPIIVNTLSEEDFLIIARVQAAKGNKFALAIIQENPALLPIHKAKEIKQKPLVKQTEKGIQNKLAKSLKGSQTEVITLVGNIDILTSSEIIEVKNTKEWKHAIGQILCYAKYYPSHNKRIHLFGAAHSSVKEMIESCCTDFDIAVTWED